MIVMLKYEQPVAVVGDIHGPVALGRWWFTVDRTAFFCIMALICIGLFLVIFRGV